jgi:hypothetical protein
MDTKLFVLPFLDIGKAPGHVSCSSNFSSSSISCRSSESGTDWLLRELRFRTMLAPDTMDVLVRESGCKLAASTLYSRNTFGLSTDLSVGSSLKVGGGGGAWLGAVFKISSMTPFFF